MKFRRRIVCLGIVSLLLVPLLLVPSLKVVAAGHKEGCSAQTTLVVCTNIRVTGNFEGYHTLYITANGTSVTCQKDSEMYMHDIYCSNPYCNVLLKQNSARKCVVHHSVCPDETGLCQY